MELVEAVVVGTVDTSLAASLAPFPFFISRSMAWAAMPMADLDFASLDRVTLCGGGPSSLFLLRNIDGTLLSVDSEVGAEPDAGAAGGGVLVAFLIDAALAGATAGAVVAAVEVVVVVVVAVMPAGEVVALGGVLRTTFFFFLSLLVRSANLFWGLTGENDSELSSLSSSAVL